MVLQKAGVCYMCHTLWVVAVYQSCNGVWIAGMMLWRVHPMGAAAVATPLVWCPLLQAQTNSTAI